MINSILSHSLWTACITPFDISGREVDYQSLQNLLRTQAEAKNGIVLFGSTGEGLSLDESEKIEILRFACALKLDAPIIVGVPGTNLKEALRSIDIFSQFPIAGYMATTPIYTKPGIIGQTKWFEELLGRTDKNVVLYNIPGRAGVSLYPEVIKNLAQYQNRIAIKDSSGTIDTLVQYRMAAPRIAIFCGDDYMLPAAAAEGAVGLISVASNIWPTATRIYVRKVLDGQRLESKVWWRASRALCSVSNPVPVKALMQSLGLIKCGETRLPLNAEDLISLDSLRQVHKEILEWESENV